MIVHAYVKLIDVHRHVSDGDIRPALARQFGSCILCVVQLSCGNQEVTAGQSVEDAVLEDERKTGVRVVGGLEEHGHEVGEPAPVKKHRAFIGKLKACDNAQKSLEKLEILINRIRQAEVTNSVIETSSFLTGE